MPNFLKKIIRKRAGKTLLASFVFILVAILNVGTNGVSLQSVIAATVNQYSFNTNAKDFDTLRSSNYTDFPNSTNSWALTTQADAGDIVSLAVYYHNESKVTAENTRVSMAVPGDASTSIQGNARLWADNFNESQGQTTVKISSSQSLTYIPGSARWYPDQSTTPTPFPFGQTGDEVITSGGVNLGDIESGWEFQGSVVARFQVSGDSNNPPTPPTGNSTIDVTANGSQGPYTLGDNEEFTVDWITSNATNCEFFLDGNLLSGVEENGSMGPIGSGHPFYPAVDSQKTFTITCEGLSGDITDNVVLVRGGVTPPDDPQDPGTSTIDVTANGSQGPLTVSGEAFTVDWISANTTNCEFSLNNELLSGVEENGSMGPIDSNHPYYPAQGGNNTFIITCEGLSGDVTDSVVVRRDLPPPPPAPLSPPVISVQTGTQCGGTIDLSWNPVSNATFYKIIRGGQTIATTTALSYTDTGLVPDQSYSYTVRALNDSQESADSSLVATMASAACVEETSDIDVTANGSQGPYTLGDNEEFTVDWITSNATNCEFFLDGNLLSGVEENGSMGPIGSGHPYYPVEGGSKTFTVTCEGLQGQISDSVVVNRPDVPEEPEVPDAPTLLSIQSSCEGTVTLTWNTVSDATLYKVFRGGTQIATTTSTSYVDNSVSANTLYSYTVRASNSVGDSTNSNVLSTTVPGSCEVPPQAPTIFAVTGTSCGGNIFISWNAVENATSYDVYRNGTLVSTTGDVSFTDTGLNFGQNYTYQVKAKNQAGVSAFSNAASANASEKCPLPDLEVSLSANPSTINKGQSSTLTWSSSNTTSCSAPWTNATSTSGNQVVSPQSDTTYNITCTDGSRTKSATTTIIVKTGGGGGDKDVTVDLTATPDTITKGQNSTLSWNSTNATSCSASWTTSTSTSGSAVVSPATTTAYSITCQNATKSASDTATVTVIEEPVCVLPAITSSLTASGKVNQAFSYTFTATSTGNFSLSVATSSLPNGLSFAGNIISGIPTEEGTFSVAISATNSCGVTEKTLVITIAPAGGGGGGNNVTVDLVANPTSVFTNATSTLSWTSNNATSCGASWTTSTSTSGNQVVTVTTTTTYSITCQNSSDSATDEVTIDILPPILECKIPELTSSLNVSGKVGDPFSYTFSANSSATSTLSFILGTSTLPQGLTYSNGVISGTPTNEGTFNVPFTISDDCGTVFDLILVITIAPAGGGGGGTNVTVDLNANPSGIFAGKTSTLSWTSTNATSCSAPWTTSTSTSGSMVVSPDQTTTYDITCMNGSQTATDSATVTILTSGGGGGGRSGGGRSGGTVLPPPLVLGDIAECEYLKDYLRIDWDNDPVEVIKLQVFLKELEGFTDLQITRVFDQQTFDAVAEFQVRYQPDILTPWGYRQGEYTGFVYILTKKKVNEIFCQKAFPLNSSQQSEIIAFRAFLESLRSQGISIPGVTEPETPGVTPPASSTIDLGPILGTPIDLEVDGGEGLLSNENLRSVAAAVFAGPDGLNETMEAIAIFILALLAIYFISKAILGRAEKEGMITPAEKRRMRLFHFLVGLALVTLIALIFSYYDIVLPLLILIIILGAVLLWFIFAKEKNQAIMIPPSEKGEANIQTEEKKGFAGLIDEDKDLPPFTEPIDEVPDETEVINEDLEN